ncbi:hypothetical protein JCM10908_003627 [Rhodotorula pacifica]|uniref:uncharacterized protein n=1 Tax=Rhodotorula pacifica TaxID=1495444 RepID=UPI00316D97AB
MSSTKDTLRHLTRLFSSPTSSSSSTASSTFPDFSLPDEVNALIDGHLRTFASSFPLSGTGGTNTGGGSTSSSSQSEGERERIRWREGLLEIWTTVEPLTGNESNFDNLAKVSAFLVLLHRLSADVGEDDDAALVSRRDIGSVWWSALLKRALLGTPKDGNHPSQAVGGGGVRLQSKGSQTRGRKPDRKGKDAAATTSSATSSNAATSSAPTDPASSSSSTSFSSTASPLYVSRQALAAAMSMVVWGMQASRELADTNSDDWISPFGMTILHEYEQRALARLQGYEDEGWGVRNLEECLIQWGEKAPKAFFVRVADSLTTDSPALIPFVSLTLSYLSRHSTKSYYALSTPLLSNLITASLTTPSAAVVSLALRSLAIFVVTLPVVIGEHLFGIMAVYGRAVSWEIATDHAGDNDSAEGKAEEEEQETPPDPMMLFTTLYGIYPCNFTAFLREAVPYLQEKGWKGAAGDGRIELASGIVRSKSEPLIRQHALSPALFTGDAASELSDTQRWSRLEAADVMAACDRNVISAVVLQQPDWRGAPPLSPTEAEQQQDSGSVPPRGRTTSIPPGTFDPLMRETPLDSASPTPKHATPEQSPVPSRAVSRARSPIGAASSPFTSPSSSRIGTPNMPPTTLYANFHALQSVGALNSPGSSASRSLPPRSQSRRRLVDSQHSELQHGWMGIAPDASGPAAPPNSATSMSRRSSGVASLGTSLGLLSPDLIPFGRGPSPAPSHPPPSSASHPQSLPPFTPNQVNAQLVKLETELVVLQGEVNFQNYLKQLHLQHMGTLHREKVLESGAEAERQSSFRTIRTLRAQLRATQNALDQVRSEQAATKANWTSHIADLRDKLSALREQRTRWEHEERVLKAELDDWKDRCEKKSRELEQEGAEFLDLRNQASMDAAKLAKISEYEHRIKTLTKTLAVCDADLVKFVEQRKEMNLLVSEYKRSEYLRAAMEDESRKLKAALRAMDNELADLRRQTLQPPPSLAPPYAPPPVAKDEISRMRAELARLRNRNAELEERLADVLDDEEAERAAAAPGRSIEDGAAL